ncbi:CC0125/CC1285 family lipoprotein [Alteromonas profundi]|nr:hypothetical protein [Alteromonas profundi]
MWFMSLRVRPLITLLSLCICISLTACSNTPSALPTPYKAAKNKDGYGYSSVQLSNNEFRVLFKATDKTPADMVQQYVLQRASELAEKQGFSHLAIIKTDIEKRPVEARRITQENAPQPTFTNDQQCTMSGCQQVAEPMPGQTQSNVEKTLINDVYYSILVRMANTSQALGKNAIKVSDIEPLKEE